MLSVNLTYNVNVVSIVKVIYLSSYNLVFQKRNSLACPSNNIFI